jgi:two-component system chemotaxis sensor kinase CheA
LPVVFLDRELGLDVERSDATDLLIVVLQAEDRQFGLAVDAVHDTEEIVVKPLQPQIKGLGVYAGATIMGDGRVALIVDVMGLAKRAGLEFGQSGRSRSMIAPLSAEPADPRVRALVFAPYSGGRMAMTLDQVSRLEEFPRSAIERLGDRRAVQFRDTILPLVDVAELLDGAPSSSPDGDAETLQVVVHEHAQGTVGFLVGRIVDVIEEAVVNRVPPYRSGVSFNSVVNGAVTEFLDVPEILRRAERLLTPNDDRNVA